MTNLVRSHLVVLTLACCVSGCYRYVPAEFDAIPVGEEVRLYLNREGVARLGEVGEGEIALSGDPVVAGTLVRREATLFSLQIPVGSRQVGFLQGPISQQVTLPIHGLVHAEMRQLSRTRTAVAVISGTAAITALVIGIISGESSEPSRTDPISDDIRIPMFSVPQFR